MTNKTSFLPNLGSTGFDNPVKIISQQNSTQQKKKSSWDLQPFKELRRVTRVITWPNFWKAATKTDSNVGGVFYRGGVVCLCGMNYGYPTQVTIVHSLSPNWPGPQITWKWNMHTGKIRPPNFMFECFCKLVLWKFKSTPMNFGTRVSQSFPNNLAIYSQSTGPPSRLSAPRYKWTMR